MHSEMLFNRFFKLKHIFYIFSYFFPIFFDESRLQVKNVFNILGNVVSTWGSRVLIYSCYIKELWRDI